MVKQNPKDDVSRPNSLSSFVEKKRKTAPVLKASNSKSPFKTTKKQFAASSLKTICTKYAIIIVLIELNQEATRLWNNGIWTDPLKGLPV
ncbi:unnamed protein product [Rhizophagus irregularis]|nr:unnamed protein product [Rhizophagus irregularis]